MTPYQVAFVITAGVVFSSRSAFGMDQSDGPTDVEPFANISPEMYRALASTPSVGKSAKKPVSGSATNDLPCQPPVGFAVSEMAMRKLFAHVVGSLAAAFKSTCDANQRCDRGSKITSGSLLVASDDISTPELAQICESLMRRFSLPLVFA